MNQSISININMNQYIFIKEKPDKESMFAIISHQQIQDPKRYVYLQHKHVFFSVSVWQQQVLPAQLPNQYYPFFICLFICLKYLLYYLYYLCIIHS